MRIGLRWRVGGADPVPQWATATPVGARLCAGPDIPPLSGLSFLSVATTLGAYLAAETDRWFVWRAAAFGAGIVAYFGLRTEPSLTVAVGITAASLIAGGLGLRTRNIALRFLCASIAAAGVGLGVAKLRTKSVTAPVILTDNAPVDIEGRIESVELRASNRARIVLAPSKIEGMEEIPRRVRLTLMGAKAVAAAEPGAAVSALAMLRPPPEPAMPAGYDFARWAYFQGIGGVGFTYGAPKLLEAPPPADWLSRFGASVSRLRLAMTARVEKAVPGQDGTIAAALITGTRAAIPEDDTEAYRDSGLAHVLSISGLHLALAGLGVFLAIRALLALSPTLALTQPIKKWTAVAAILAAGFYLLISGAASPAVRSYLMLAAMLVSVLADRPALSMRAVAMAALAILFFHPEDIVNPGFQMSFAAVIGLIALAEWVTSRPRNEEPRRSGTARLLRWSVRALAMVLATSLVATLATTPFAIYHFDRAASYSLLANLLAEPVVAFLIMPSAAIAVVLMPFGLEY